MSLSDYSDLESSITNAPEPKILPRGSEVKARIIALNSGVSDKNNAHWHQLTFDVPDDPMVIEFRHFFWDLVDRDKIDPKQVARSLYTFKTFAASFGIDYSRPFNWEDFITKEGWVILGVKKDDQYGDQNTITKFVTSHKPAVASGAAAAQAGITNDDIPF